MTSVDVRHRSIKHARQSYRDLAATMDVEQARYLASYRRHQAGITGAVYPPPGEWAALVQPQVTRTREQYLAYAAYWASIADARATSQAS